MLNMVINNNPDFLISRFDSENSTFVDSRV